MPDVIWAELAIIQPRRFFIRVLPAACPAPRQMADACAAAAGAAISFRVARALRGVLSPCRGVAAASAFARAGRIRPAVFFADIVVGRLGVGHRYTFLLRPTCE